MARPAHGKTGRRRRGTRRTLTPQMRRFLVEYLLGSSAKGAAVKAGYSRRTAKQGGHNVLHHPAVKRALARHLEHANLTAARTLEELRRLAFADVPSLYDDDHQLLPFSLLTPEQRSLIAGVETIVKNAEGGDGHTDRVLKLRVWDKTKALELLAKYYGLLVERVQVDATENLLIGVKKKGRRAGDVSARMSGTVVPAAGFQRPRQGGTISWTRQRNFDPSANSQV